MVSKHYECSIINCIDWTLISYCAYHNHHKNSDTEKDPHSPKHVNWFRIIFRTHEHEGSIKLASKRLRNKWQMWLTKMKQS